MSPENARELAQDALVWIAQSDDLAGVFLGWSGSSPAELRARAEDEVFLASVLEFLTMDDAWVTGFCDSRGIDYCQPMRARQRLEGPGQAGWT